MQAPKHPFHAIDYEYLRPSKQYIKPKGPETEWTHYKGEPVYRNLYYGTKIPDDQKAKVDGYNQMIAREIQAGTIKPHCPEFWSYHDSWRFADAAGYKEEDMVRDIKNHSPWLEEMKNWNLSEGAAEILKKGAMYVYGRDKNGFPNIWVDYKKVSTSKEQIQFAVDALIFLSATVKKFMLLPYYAELFNVVVDVGNCSVFSLSKDFLKGIFGIHQLHWKNSMFKVIIYNPSFTFWALWKIVQLFYNKKYLERARIVKKGNEKELWEILDQSKTAARYGGTAPDLPEGQSFWPPRCLDSDPITKQEIKDQGLMTFDFIGHHADKTFWTKYEPWETEVKPEARQWDTFGKGKLDKTC